MSTDAQHPFICLWALCKSSLEKCLLKSFAHFLIGLFVFLEWSHVSSLYILEIKPLSEVSLANMFSHMVGSLFILMLFSLAMQKPFILRYFFYWKLFVKEIYVLHCFPHSLLCWMHPNGVTLYASLPIVFPVNWWFDKFAWSVLIFFSMNTSLVFWLPLILGTS